MMADVEDRVVLTREVDGSAVRYSCSFTRPTPAPGSFPSTLCAEAARKARESGSARVTFNSKAEHNGLQLSELKTKVDPASLPEVVYDRRVSDGGSCTYKVPVSADLQTPFPSSLCEAAKTQSDKVSHHLSVSRPLAKENLSQLLESLKAGSPIQEVGRLEAHNTGRLTAQERIHETEFFRFRVYTSDSHPLSEIEAQTVGLDNRAIHRLTVRQSAVLRPANEERQAAIISTGVLLGELTNRKTSVSSGVFGPTEFHFSAADEASLARKMMQLSGHTQSSEVSAKVKVVSKRTLDGDDSITATLRVDGNDLCSISIIDLQNAPNDQTRYLIKWTLK